MTGIKYITNDKGEKQSVIIDLKKWGDIIEDIFDAIEAKSRVNEKSESYDSVRKKILAKHK
jgi:hypothetical protein